MPIFRRKPWRPYGEIGPKTWIRAPILDEKTYRELKPERLAEQELIDNSVGPANR